ncbi:MAG: RICIN domain-containing protein [Coriobacteriales bacterium]|jgi:hypothetical protein|nr:RICIN domain-containing protein [Coriobacteriales bacterium]
MQSKGEKNKRCGTWLVRVFSWALTALLVVSTTPAAWADESAGESGAAAGTAAGTGESASEAAGATGTGAAAGTTDGIGGPAAGDDSEDNSGIASAPGTESDADTDTIDDPEAADTGDFSTLDAASALAPYPAPASYWQNDFIYVAASYNLVLDIHGASTTAGANVISWPVSYSSNQRFNIQPGGTDAVTSETLFTIQAAHSGKVLDIYGGALTPGTRIIQWTVKAAGSNLNQLWKLRRSADGKSVIFVSAADGNLVLDVGSVYGSQNLTVQTYDPGADGQRFWIVDSDSSSLQPFSLPQMSLSTSEPYSLIATVDAPEYRRLDIPGAASTQGLQPTLWTMNNNLNQDFLFTPDPAGSGFYRIQPLNSGLYLDVYANQRLPGAAIIQWSATGGDNQLFAVLSVGPCAQIISVSSGMALAVNSAGQLVLAKPNSADPYQLFNLEAHGSTVNTLVDDLIGTDLIYWYPVSDSAKRIDINGAGSAGSTALLWESNGNLNQKFQFQPIGSNTNTYALLSAHAGTWLAASGGGAGSSLTTLNAVSGVSSAPATARWTPLRAIGGYKLKNGAGGYLALSGSNLTIVANLNDATLFRYAATTFFDNNAYYQLRNGSQYLDITGASRANNAALTLWPLTGGANQKFRIVYRSGEYFSIQGAASTRALDITGNNTTPGTAIIQWDYNGNANQLWRGVIVPGQGTVLQSKLSPNLYLGNIGAANGQALTTTNLAGALPLVSIRTTYSATGNAELDAKVANILNFIGTGGDVLYKCFNYVVYNYSYRSGSLWPSGNWVPGYALEMIDYGSGNCYRYAALFCVLAQQSGYDARAVIGYGVYNGNSMPHGWVEVTINGSVYVCDPEGADELGWYGNWYMNTYSNAPITYRK